jgi:hypothetical protein
MGTTGVMGLRSISTVQLHQTVCLDASRTVCNRINSVTPSHFDARTTSSSTSQPGHSAFFPPNNINHKMPGLTVETTSSSPSQPSYQPSPSQPQSRSSSPIRPTYSPITPTLSAARLATAIASNASSQNETPAIQSQTQAPAQIQRTFIHSQPPQQFIPHPPAAPDPISLEDNPDAIAMRSAISILQMQRQNVANDIRTLQAIKIRALADPEAFTDALVSGELKTRPNPHFGIAVEDEDGDGDSDKDDKNEGDEVKERDKAAGSDVAQEDASMTDVPSNSTPAKKRKWPYMPTPQNVVKMPNVNWAQYGVMGDSLDLLHQDQMKNPTAGQPARLGPNGEVIIPRIESQGKAVGFGTPTQGGKMERMGTRKGGKR